MAIDKRRGRPPLVFRDQAWTDSPELAYEFAIARTALLKLLVADEQTHENLTNWAERIGILGTVDRQPEVRAATFRRVEARPLAEVSPLPEIDELLANWHLSSWDWLRLDLVQIFVTTGFAPLTGHKPMEVSKMQVLAPDKALQADLALDFRAQEGEGARDALTRFAQAANSFLEELAREIPPPPKLPTQATARALEKAATYFYRHRIKGESIKSISGSLSTLPAEILDPAGRRSEVRRWVTRLEQALAAPRRYRRTLAAN